MTATTPVPGTTLPAATPGVTPDTDAIEATCRLRALSQRARINQAVEEALLVGRTRRRVQVA